jgi:hypothetical protein
MYKHNLEALSSNHRCRRKAVSITYSEYVFLASVIHHTKSMHRIILYYVVCPVLPYFPKFSHKWHDFGKKNLPNIKYVLIFLPLMSKTFSI